MSTATQLNGWNEIAAYLGESVSTAHRWETESHLPIHRIKTQNGEIVFALVAELEAWLLSHSAESDRQEEPGLPISGSDVSSEATPPVGLQHFAADSVKLLWLVFGSTTIVIVLIIVAMSLNSYDKRPVNYRMEQNALVILNETGREIWRRNFDSLSQGFYDRDGHRAVWFGDLNRTGRKQVLFVEAPAGRLSRSATLRCYSSNGREMWSFTPNRAVRTATQAFEPIYSITDFEVIPTPTGNLVALTAAHYLYFAAQVVLLDSNGKVVGEYWHPGHFGQVRAFDLNRDGHTRLYLSGVNNEFKAATLVVLDLDKVNGAARQIDPKYQFQDIPAASESARIFFSRSCINRSVSEYNTVRSASQRPNTLLVDVNEQPGAAHPVALMYEISPDLRHASISVVDGFRAAHREMKSENRIDHEFSNSEITELEKGYSLNVIPPRTR